MQEKLLILTKTREKKPYIFFVKIYHAKILEKTPKNHQEIIEMYFGIFVKGFDAQEVQEAKSRGVISKKEAKNEKKQQERTQAQRSNGFWIIQVLHERWIDPDHS